MTALTAEASTSSSNNNNNNSDNKQQLRSNATTSMSQRPPLQTLPVNRREAEKTTSSFKNFLFKPVGAAAAALLKTEDNHHASPVSQNKKPEVNTIKGVTKPTTTPIPILPAAKTTTRPTLSSLSVHSHTKAQIKANLESQKSAFRPRTVWKDEDDALTELWTLKRANPVFDAEDEDEEQALVDELQQLYASPSKRNKVEQERDEDCLETLRDGRHSRLGPQQLEYEDEWPGVSAFDALSSTTGSS